MPDAELAFVSKHVGRLDMSDALAPIDQRLQAELVVMYKDTPDGRVRLWPSGAMAHF